LELQWIHIGENKRDTSNWSARLCHGTEDEIKMENNATGKTPKLIND
jgi:hypothetical protein